MALLLFGQARLTHRVAANPDFSILSVIERYKPDVYCCFWNEPEAFRSLDLFYPKDSLLLPTDDFPKWKEEWWQKWSAQVSLRQNVSHRWPMYNNEMQHSRDNTIRYWILVSHGIKMIVNDYDVVIASRPDVGFIRYPVVAAVDENVVAAQNRKLYTHLDQFFWGRSETMRSLLQWDRMIYAMAKAELTGKYGRRPMALAKGENWLAGENTLALTIELNGFTLDPRDFRTYVIRRLK